MPNPPRREVFFEPGAQANPNRGLKLLSVGLVKNWSSVPTKGCPGYLALIESGTETYASWKLTRLEIWSSSSLGTVVNSYRRPRFRVKDGRSCQLSWKYAPIRSWRKLRGGLSPPGSMPSNR